MKKQFYLAALIAALIFLPAAAAADAGIGENLAYLSVDRVDRSMGRAIDLFQMNPVIYLGDEKIAFRGRTMTSAKWYRLGYTIYEKAWDHLMASRYEECVRSANQANDVFQMLIQHSKTLK